MKAQSGFRRKRVSRAPVNHERWIVSYADLITLLFAFFVVLYSISRLDAGKLKKVGEGLRSTLGQGGAKVTVSESSPDQAEVKPAKAQLTAGAATTGELLAVQSELEDAITLEVGMTASELVRTDVDDRGLVIKIAAEDFFASGDTKVKPELMPILDRIAKVLAKNRRLIQIEGHTDEKESASIQSWEFSARRAAGVAQYWITKHGFDPRRIGISGYSHYRPLTSQLSEIDGNTEWGRGKNRRLEIVVKNEKLKTPTKYEGQEFSP